MSRPHRLAPQSYVGFRRYYLTICTHERRCHFADAETVTETLSQFLRVAFEESFEIVAYCLMPDHLHLIVVATSATADLRRFVRLAKQRSGFCFSRRVGERLWQTSYFERVVRDDQSLAALVEYVVHNPVRAGIAQSPAEYPYWGSQAHTRGEILEFLSVERRV